MAQGSQKFKAQRAGAAKKQHQNKQKGPKKGGTVRGDEYLLHEPHIKKIRKVFLCVWTW